MDSEVILDRLDFIQKACLQLRNQLGISLDKKAAFKKGLKKIFKIESDELQEIKETLLMRLISFLADFNIPQLKSQVNEEEHSGLASSSLPSSSSSSSPSLSILRSFNASRSKRYLKPPEEFQMEESEELEGNCACQIFSQGLQELGTELAKFKSQYNEDQKFVLAKYSFIQPLISESLEICDFSVAERVDSTRDIGNAQEIEDMLVHIASEVVSALGIQVVLAERLIVGLPIAEAIAGGILTTAAANSTINEYRQMNLYGTKVNVGSGGHKLTPNSFNAAAAARETHPQKRKYYQPFAQFTSSTQGETYGAFGAGHSGPSRRNYFAGFKARKLADGSALPTGSGTPSTWARKK